MRAELGWILVGAVMVGAAACTFPGYRVDVSAAGSANQPAGGGGSAGSATGGGGNPAGGSASLGGAGTAGTAGTLSEAGSAGEGGGAEEPGIVRGFTDAALTELDFILLGSAALEPDGIAITRRNDKNMIGAVVQKRQLDLGAHAELEVVVGIRITPGDQNGDGLAIMIHASPDGPTRIGSGGGGFGYGGIAPCVAVELDTAAVANEDYPAPHVGLMLNCNPDDPGPTSIALGGNPSDGGDWLLSLRWSRATGLLEAVLRNEATGYESAVSSPFDLQTQVGSRVFVGVTAANGEFSATHFIRSLRLAGGGIGPLTLTSSL